MNHNDILGVTMAGLEAGFKVSHIAAFELEVCAPEMNVSQVLSDPRLKDFDHVPVREGTRILGVLECESLKGLGAVKDSMRWLDGEMLVSAEEPLTKFLPTLVHSQYRLVVRGTKVEGIVTFSDVAKLPVRLLAFTLVAHFEAILAQVIRRECGNDEDWLSLLGPGQRRNIEDLLRSRKKENIHLTSKIEVAGFRHKIIVVGQLRKLPNLNAARDSIVDFRNSLAHDGDFVKECGGVKGFLERISLVQHWVDALNYEGGVRGDTNA